jgi:hypothetical protein
MPLSTRAALVGKTDAEMMVVWSLKNNGEKLFTMPRVAVWRSFVMNHLIHHRAQLGVYLRLNDVPVPAVYGPTADESRIFEAPPHLFSDLHRSRYREWRRVPLRVSDQAGYVPAVMLAENPAAFPHDASLIRTHAQFFVIDELLGGIGRATGVSLESRFFVAYLVAMAAVWIGVVLVGWSVYGSTPERSRRRPGG